MGEFRDAVDTLLDLKEFAEIGIYPTKRSISASAMDGTANFPVLVDDTLSLDDALLISRAAEKKFASFLLTVLTMDPYLEVTKGQTPSASRYLHQFHQNIRTQGPDKGAHISLVNFAQEAADVTDMEYSLFESEAFRVASAIYEGVTQSIPQNINAKFNYVVSECLIQESLNNKFRKSIFEGRGANPQHGNGIPRGGAQHRQQPITVNIPPIQANINMGDIIGRRQDTTINQGKQNVRDRGTQWHPLTDNECKKANDLVPTLLHVRVYPIDKFTREELTPIDFIIGVKATLHPIPVDEITRMTIAGMRNENTAFNFIRWTTGEIKFWKDFVFAVDNAKMDAKDAGGDVTGWRPALKKRRLLSKSRVRLTPASILPNATLVISQPTIENILETYGYNLADQMIRDRMMDVYFLLAYVIANPVTKRVTFKFDGFKATDTYTYDTLQRETSSDDKAFKNMMKMLGRSM